MQLQLRSEGSPGCGQNWKLNLLTSFEFWEDTFVLVTLRGYL
jgi:hypothetical protein